MKVSILVAFALLALNFSLFAGGTKEEDSTMKSDNSMMKSDNSMMKSDNSMMKSDNSMMKSDNSMMKSDNSMMKSDNSMMKSNFFDVSGLGKQVVAFTSEADAWELAKTQNVVYFFAASWCPDCNATMKDIRANYMQIPSNTTIVVVNYDKANDLKTKYGVASQHTFVVVGSKGEKKKIWSGAANVADIVKNASKM